MKIVPPFGEGQRLSPACGTGVGGDSVVPLPSVLSGGADRKRLHEPDVVPERVAQPAVDTVVPLGRLLGDLDAFRSEFLIRLLAVGGCEEEVATRGTLRYQLAGPLRRTRVLGRRTRLLQQDLAAVTWHVDRQPAHEAQVLVAVDLEAQLADIEVERLVLVENVNRRDRESVEHR